MSTHWHQEKVPSQFFFICYITIWNWSYRYCRKRAKKTRVKVGRKKAKKGTTAEEAPTPRTRAAVTREATAKAKREALELELKATTAREAAQSVVREEAEAAQAAIAREAAQAAARKEAEAAQAAAAREAAQAAAAARDEFSATQAHEQVIEVMPLEVELLETAIQTTTARRYCSSSYDSMIIDNGLPV